MPRGIYLQFDKSVEEIQPDEDKIIDKIIASGDRLGKAALERNGRALRAAHAKNHGILKGTLTVCENLPDHLRQGLFATPRSYPIIVRFSTGFGDLRSDRIPNPRGMAIKVLWVEGDRLCPDDTSANQDILLVNHSTYFSDIATYERFAGMVADVPKKSNFNLSLTAAVASFFNKLLNGFRPKIFLRMLFSTVADTGHHILGETYHSQAALRFGDYIAKLSAVPTGETKKLAGAPVGSGDDSLGQLVSNFLKTNAAEYELRAQLCTDLKHMPVEDAWAEWPEKLSLPQVVARITLPAGQDPLSPARCEHGDRLSFTPWRGLSAHQPLGSIMRLRKKAYEASSAFRHRENKQPFEEPRAISDFPD